jgi:hypothetical protein
MAAIVGARRYSAFKREIRCWPAGCCSRDIHAAKTDVANSAAGDVG